MKVSFSSFALKTLYLYRIWFHIKLVLDTESNNDFDELGTNNKIKHH